MMAGSYRPQSPDLSSLHTTYRPQSPDLASLPHAGDGLSQSQSPQSRLKQQYTSTGFQSFQGPPPTSSFQQNTYEYQAPPYANSIGLVKEEYHDFPTIPPTTQEIKSETMTDPTHGVVLKTSFPVARIKRIMQADEDIGKVSQVVPPVTSRALELFMIKLITAASEQAKGPAAGAGKGPRRVLAQHLKRAIQADDTFDFLADIIAKVPDAPAKATKRENGKTDSKDSDSEEAKPRKKGKKKKESTDDY